MEEQEQEGQGGEAAEGTTPGSQTTGADAPAEETPAPGEQTDEPAGDGDGEPAGDDGEGEGEPAE